MAQPDMQAALAAMGFGLDGYPTDSPLKILLQNWKLLSDYNPTVRVLTDASVNEARTWLISNHEQAIHDLMVKRYFVYQQQFHDEILTNQEAR